MKIVMLNEKNHKFEKVLSPQDLVAALAEHESKGDFLAYKDALIMLVSTPPHIHLQNLVEYLEVLANNRKWSYCLEVVAKIRKQYDIVPSKQVERIIDLLKLDQSENNKIFIKLINKILEFKQPNLELSVIFSEMFECIIEFSKPSYCPHCQAQLMPVSALTSPSNTSKKNRG